MKIAFIGLLVALCCGFSSAQSNNQTLPPCAETCAAAFTTPGEVAGCNGQNIACICSNSTFISSIACCLSANCDAADQVIATGYAQQLCGDNGVTVPSAVSCLSSSSTATATQSSATSNLTVATTATTTSSKTSSTATTASTGGAGFNNAGIGAGVAGGLLAVLALFG